jgi:hypothetical protein
MTRTHNPPLAMSVIYDHAFTIAFSVRSPFENGCKVAPQEFRHAILARLAALTDDELLEAVGMPFDTYEVESEARSAGEQP